MTDSENASAGTPAAPEPGDLPSSRTLLRSTVIALAAAALILVTIVLPAEYGIDPTGVGRPLGLTRMGQIKVSLAAEAARADAEEAAARSAAGVAGPRAEAPAVAPPVGADAPGAVASEPGGRSDSISVVLQPGQGAEYKLAMRKDARAEFTWTVAGGVVNYDQHADRPGLSYHGYEKGQATPSATGVMIAAFDGWHGWFWRNRGPAPVTVTLRTSGDNQEIKRVE
jgi:hypothetical protein